MTRAALRGCPFQEVEMEARREFLALAEACGARLSGKPDGSEPIEVIFSIEAWRAFDTAQPPAALAGEREAFDESSFDLPPLDVSNPLVGLIAAGGEPAKKIQDYLWECGRAGWSARTIADPTTFLDGKATSWIATCPKCDCSIHFASRPTTQATAEPAHTKADADALCALAVAGYRKGLELQGKDALIELVAADDAHKAWCEVQRQKPHVEDPMASVSSLGITVKEDPERAAIIERLNRAWERARRTLAVPSGVTKQPAPDSSDDPPCPPTERCKSCNGVGSTGRIGACTTCGGMGFVTGQPAPDSYLKGNGE